MRFVDRIQEKERLTKILNMDRPTFTAIYGRRRLGKSTLITRVITDNSSAHIIVKGHHSRRHYGVNEIAYEPKSHSILKSLAKDSSRQQKWYV